MKKIMLQLGLLAFCVAAVAFQTQGAPLLETVARSFLVFILVVVGAAAVLLVSSMFRARGETEESAHTGARESSAAQTPPNHTA